MLRGIFKCAIALAVIFSCAPAETFADWSSLGLLSKLSSSIYLNTSRYSYRVKQNLYFSSGGYFASEQFYDLHKASNFLINNSQEYSYNYVHSFRVQIDEIGRLIPEMTSDPYGFHEWVLTTAKSYPVACSIDLHTGWIYENYTWKNRPVEIDLTCSNVAKGSEAAFARSVGLKGANLYLQYEH